MRLGYIAGGWDAVDAPGTAEAGVGACGTSGGIIVTISMGGGGEVWLSRCWSRMINLGGLCDVCKLGMLPLHKNGPK